MHVFASPELKISLSDGKYYAAVRSSASGAPFRSITVRDTIGDLPEVGNGANRVTMDVIFYSVERIILFSFFPLCVRTFLHDI
jgi:hypothetical protein